MRAIRSSSSGLLMTSRPSMYPFRQRIAAAVLPPSGAPPDPMTSAAIGCLNGYMLGRLVINKPELEERIARMGIKDKNKIYTAEDLAPGKQMIFAATGVTDGSLMRGVRFFGEGTRTSSVI